MEFPGPTQHRGGGGWPRGRCLPPPAPRGDGEYGWRAGFAERPLPSRLSSSCSLARKTGLFGAFLSAPLLFLCYGLRWSSGGTRDSQGACHSAMPEAPRPPCFPPHPESSCGRSSEGPYVQCPGRSAVLRQRTGVKCIYSACSWEL